MTECVGVTQCALCLFINTAFESFTKSNCLSQSLAAYVCVSVLKVTPSACVSVCVCVCACMCVSVPVVQRLG